jgi:hypothetical protein
VLVRTDFTLRRFQNAEDVESDVPSKLPRSYRLQEIDFIVQVRASAGAGPGQRRRRPPRLPRRAQGRGRGQGCEPAACRRRALTAPRRHGALRPLLAASLTRSPPAPSPRPTPARVQEVSPRFSIRMKSHSLGGGEGETLKLSAETDAERQTWMRVLAKLKESIPPEEEDDDPYRECARRWTRQPHGGAGAAAAAAWERRPPARLPLVLYCGSPSPRHRRPAAESPSRPAAPASAHGLVSCLAPP